MSAIREAESLESGSGAERDCCAGRGKGDEESCCGRHGGRGEHCCSGADVGPEAGRGADPTAAAPSDVE